MFKRILVVLDGSADGERVISHAIDAAKCFKALVFLVQRVPEISVEALQPLGTEEIALLAHTPVGEAIDEDAKVRAGATTYLESIEGRFTVEGIRAYHYLITEDLSKSMPEFCEHERIDLVMGALDGRQAARVADAIVNQYRIAVLVVPRQAAELCQGMNHSLS